MEERLQKVLARYGFGSRRSCEKLIAEGRVTVNHQKITLGAKADPQQDEIAVDGKVLKAIPENVYIALNKPKYVLSDESEDGDRKTVFDFIPPLGHMFSVGRLDFDSEGLILLTNDGSLANILTHPRYGHEKEYRVTLRSKPDLQQLTIWRRGVVLEDGYKTAPAKVWVISTEGDRCVVGVIMKEGKKRQIREVAARIGLSVSRLIRVRIGTLELGNLKTGQWRHLKKQEIKDLKQISNLKNKQRSKDTRGDRN